MSLGLNERFILGLREVQKERHSYSLAVPLCHLLRNQSATGFLGESPTGKEPVPWPGVGELQRTGGGVGVQRFYSYF